jgi:hypothetical protein
MSLSAESWDEGKLEILRGLDRYRRWSSLDEKRYCIVCGKVVTGREIEIVGGTGETGPLRAICPTESCPSIPMDWVLPTEEVLASRAMAPGDDQRPAAVSDCPA